MSCFYRFTPSVGINGVKQGQENWKFKSFALFTRFVNNHNIYIHITQFILWNVAERGRITCRSWMLSCTLNSSRSFSLILKFSLKNTEKQPSVDRKLSQKALLKGSKQRRVDVTHVEISSVWASTVFLSSWRSSLSWLIFITARSYFCWARLWNRC